MSLVRISPPVALIRIFRVLIALLFISNNPSLFRGFSRSGGDTQKVLARYLLRATANDEKLESFLFTCRAL
jgi:hypothetical protein